MKIFKALTIPFLVSALAACGAEGQPTDPNNPDPDAPDNGEPIEVSGEYRVTSHFELSPRDLAKDIELVNLLEDIGQDPYGALADVISDEAGVSFLSPVVKTLLEENLPQDLEDDVKDLANTILDASAAFDVTSNLTIEGDSNLSVKHRAVGMEVEIEGKRYEWAFDGPESEATAAASRSADDISIESHEIVVPYSQMLVAVVDVVVVPTIDPGADDLGEALATLVDCQAVGQALADYELIPGLGASTYRAFCQVGTAELGNQIYDRVADIADLKTRLELRGTVSAEDVSGNGRADRIQGKWNGQFSVAANTSFTDAGTLDGERVR